MGAHTNDAIQAIRKGLREVDSLNAQLDDHTRAKARGENPDGQAFVKLVEKRMVSMQAMQAQVKLNEKPLHTVLTESK
jgi:hypothetical protein